MVYDGSGTLLRRVDYTYTNTTAIPRKSTLSAVDSYEYDASGGSKHVVASYPSYDAYGNRLQEVITGGVTATDDIQTDWQYSPNSGAYIVGLVGRIERRAPGGSLLAADEFLYDGAGAWSVPPVKGDLTKHRRYLDAPSQYVARTAVFDSWGNQTSTTDETSRTLTTTFDSTDHLFPVSVQNAAGETQGMVWDAGCGAVTQSTDENGQTTTRQYDPLCRPTQTNAPLGAFEIRSYLDFGNPSLQRARVETPSAAGVSGNHWVEDSFDGVGHTYRSRARGPSSGQDIIVDRTYNARGALESISEPYYAAEAVYFTSYEYDALNRGTAMEHPDGNRVETTYGVSSVTETDENGKTTTAQFDDSGHMVLEQRSLNGQTVATTSTYDTLGRLVGMTDALGNNWQWTIDSLGRATSASDPDAGSWSATYDAAGRALTSTDAKGQQTAFTYDAVGRPQTKASQVGTVTFGWGQARTGYHNVASLTSVNAPGVTQLFDYDALGRVGREKRIIQGVSYVASKQYDAAGRVLTLTYPDGDVIGPIGYDQAGRLLSIPGVVNEVTYDAGGRSLTQSNANGTQTARTYSAARGFLETILTTGPSTTQDLIYGHDAVGLVTQVTSPHANQGWSYGYDDLYRLTQATSLSNPAESQGFAYDEIGRITYNSRVGNYTYPGVGQPRPHAPSSVNGAPYNYDANGNLVSGGGRSPVWDAENRIAQIGSAQFNYDGFGERVKKTAPGVTSFYPFGDDYEITNGQVTKYISVDGLGVVAKRVGAATYWLHTDRLGSIQALTNSAGAEVLRRTYRPYGAKIADSTGHVESRGWIDQRQDAETALTYLHARYYDSELGVFLSPDPLGAAGGLNAYAYASGNPVNASDRSGLIPCNPNDTICIELHYQSGGGGGGSNPFGSVFGLVYGLQAIGRGIDAFADWLGGLFGGGGIGTVSSLGAPPVSSEVEFSGRPDSTDREFPFPNGTSDNPIDPGPVDTPPGGGPIFTPGPGPGPGPGPAPGPGPGPAPAPGRDSRVGPRPGPTQPRPVPPANMLDFVAWQEGYPTVADIAADVFDPVQLGMAALPPGRLAGPIIRRAAPRAAFLRSLANNTRTPSWMKQWLRLGRTPPGYQVDHIRPLSIGGADDPSNMRMILGADHKIHHKFYRPWQWW